MTVQEMKRELAALTEQERADLAFFLIESLDPQVDLDAQAAWDAELDRRATEIRSGRAIGKPAEQVFSDLRKAYS